MSEDPNPDEVRSEALIISEDPHPDLLEYEMFEEMLSIMGAMGLTGKWGLEGGTKTG